LIGIGATDQAGARDPADDLRTARHSGIPAARRSTVREDGVRRLRPVTRFRYGSPDENRKRTGLHPGEWDED